MKRSFDIVVSSILFLVLLLPMIFIGLAVILTSKGPIFYWSDRVGQNNTIFKMPKFRTMKIDAPTLATHLIKNPNDFISPVGVFLRNTSLDELPQLYSIIKGDMSIIGPRPALYNQRDLITLRTEKKLDKLLPGLTGWAQVNGRDELSIPEKVEFEIEYMQRKSFWFDLKILWMTFLKVLNSRGISH